MRTQEIFFWSTAFVFAAVFVAAGVVTVTRALTLLRWMRRAKSDALNDLRSSKRLGLTWLPPAWSSIHFISAQGLDEVVQQKKGPTRHAFYAFIVLGVSLLLYFIVMTLIVEPNLFVSGISAPA